MQVKFAESHEERKEALEVFSKNFPRNYYELRDLIGFFLENSPQLQCLVVIDTDSRVIGAMCLLDRIFNYCGVECNVTGMSYIAIEPEFQNSSVIHLIINAMNEYINTNADMSMAFARKAMDNYWYPYGYRGFTNFCQITYMLRNLPKIKSKLTSSAPTDKFLPKISSIYSITYRNVFGALKRNFSLWNFYLKRYLQTDVKFEVLSKDHEPVGYFLIQGNVVLEVGIEKKYLIECTKFIANYLREKNFSEAVFEIGQRHPLTVYLSKYEHSISSRYVWNGGHIVKIHFVLLFLQKISQTLQLRSEQSNLKDFDFVCNSIQFLFKNGSFLIEPAVDRKDNISFLKEEWPKLIFGVVEPKYLIGFKADDNEFILNILFPKMSPQIPWLDQF